MDNMPFYHFEPIELLRDQLLEDQTQLEVTDHGAGGAARKVYRKKVKEIAAHSAVSAKYGRLLFRLVNHFKPKTIVELGTSLGISTLYLAMPSSENTVYTLEGSVAVSEKASVSFQKLHCHNIKAVTGNFDDTLINVLDQVSTVDFAYVDGNHLYEPTLRYFEQLLKKTNEGSCFVFDDIHWSSEMSEAWKAIKQHPEVTVTIDLYRFGLVFFRTGIPKQDFVLKY